MHDLMHSITEHNFRTICVVILMYMFALSSELAILFGKCVFDQIEIVQHTCSVVLQCFDIYYTYACMVDQVLGQLCGNELHGDEVNLNTV